MDTVISSAATPWSMRMVSYLRKLHWLSEQVSFIAGVAYVGNTDELNTTDAAIVRCKSSVQNLSGESQDTDTFSVTSDSSNEWLASPNVTVGGNSTWSNATFFVPTSENSDRRVGFLNGNSTSANKITSGFRLYGSMAALVTDDGKLESLWTGLQVSAHLHALYWNDTSLGQIPITLTSVAPSNPSD